MKLCRLGGLAVAGAFMATCPWPAFAQRAPDAPLERFGPIGGARLQLNAGTDDDNGTIALELPQGPSQEWRFGLILSAPLNDEDEAEPATLDGLAGGTNLTLRIGRFDIPAANPPDSRAREIEGEAIEECEQRRRNPATGAASEPVEGCRTEPVSNVVARYTRDVREYNAHLLPYDATDYGFELSVGLRDFDFIDPVTLAEQEDRKTQWSAAAFYNRYLRGSKTAITVSAAYERSYEQADEEIFCPVPSGTDPVRCITARGAPPERDESLLLSAGVRHQFMRGGRLIGLAVSPLLTYDVLDDVWGAEVPVYFLPNTEGGLTGGVRFGYRSDREDEFSVGIFIGAAFNVLN